MRAASPWTRAALSNVTIDCGFRSNLMVVLVACVPLGVAMPAWASLVLLMSLLLALVTYETLHFAPWRRHLRSAHEEHHAGEH